MRRKIVNRESGRRVSQESDYVAMTKRTTDKAVFDKMIIKHSEYKKPYMSKDYSDMEYDFAAPYGITPGAMGAGVDFPWMGGNNVNLNLIPMGQKGGVGSVLSWAESCAGVKIAFTSQQMNVGEEQSLSITGGGSGAGWDWEITSGGGSLSTSFFSFNTYTAPATNVNCADNPTIKLKCNGKVVDTLKMAVNGQTDYASWSGISAAAVYSNAGCTGPNAAYYEQKVLHKRYNCWGEEVSSCQGGAVMYCCPKVSETNTCVFCEITDPPHAYSCADVANAVSYGGCSLGGQTPNYWFARSPENTKQTGMESCCPSQLL
jgi:hypothetical protein